MANIKIPWEGWELAKEKPIGKGGFGEVYEIKRNMYGLEERAAMKILSIPKDESDLDALRFEGLDDDSIARTYHGYVSNMVKEYETMQRLRNNPHVVHVYDLQVKKDSQELLWTVYIRMELLTPIMKNPSCIQSEKQILQLAKDICSALIACHKRNILHRDIKPENIFIDPDGNYKIGDFGISRIVEHTTRASVGVGTYDYMSPEVINGNSYGLQADIYSLGMVLYYLMNERRHPFFPLPPAVPTYEEKQEARNRKWSGEPIPPPKNGCADFKRIIMKACAFSPNNRYLTVQNMLDELNRVNLEEKTVVPPKPVEPPTVKDPPGDDSDEDFDDGSTNTTESSSAGTGDDTPTQYDGGDRSGRPQSPPEVPPEKPPKNPKTPTSIRNFSKILHNVGLIGIAIFLILLFIFAKKFFDLMRGDTDGNISSTPKVNTNYSELVTQATEAMGQITEETPENNIMAQESSNTDPEESNATIPTIGFSDLKPGEIIELGRYEQDGKTTNGAEPIEWLVLAAEDNEVLIVSVLGLETLPYEESQHSVDWENCSSRAWLEESFYENAFTDSEKRSIIEKEVIQHKNKGYPYADQGNNTMDHIFLLSTEEYITYLYDNNDIDPQFREGIPSEYVLQKDIEKYDYHKGERCWWWLRTSSAYNEKACFVAAMGPSEVYVGYPVNKLGGIIRPAMWMALSENTEDAQGIEAASIVNFSGVGSDCEHIFEVLNTSDGIATKCRFCGISQNDLPDTYDSISYGNCEHSYETILQTNGTPAYECLKCHNIQIMQIASLTDLRKLRDTNAHGKNKDVIIGDFREDSGKEIEDAVRFWVVDKSGYTNTESVDFYLANSYTTLSGLVFAGEQSENGANMTLRFYGDERLIGEITNITKDKEYCPEIDVSDVEVLRVECSTQKSAHGYCFIQASVSY